MIKMGELFGKQTKALIKKKKKRGKGSKRKKTIDMLRYIEQKCTENSPGARSSCPVF